MSVRCRRFIDRLLQSEFLYDFCWAKVKHLIDFSCNERIAELLGRSFVRRFYPVLHSVHVKGSRAVCVHENAQRTGYADGI